MGRFSSFATGSLGVALACGFLSACTQAPDMSGIQKERQKAVHRYDIGQAIASNGKVVVAGTQSGAALVSRDYGKSWVRSVLGPVSLVDITVCGEGFLGIDHYHKVWTADAEGANWKSAPLADPKTPLAVACDKQGHWWVSGIRAVIASSADQGATWKVTDFGEDTQITTLQFIDDKHGIALGEFGLTVMTEDGGATWQKGAKMPGEFYPYAAVFTTRNEGWVASGQVEKTIKWDFHFLNFMHRTNVAPVPEFTPNPSGIYRAIYVKAQEPQDLKNTQLLIQRFEDDSRLDDAYLYLGFQRRVRRLAQGQVTDSFLGSDLMIEDFEGYNGRVSDMKWTYKGTKNVLLPMWNHNELKLSDEFKDAGG